MRITFDPIKNARNIAERSLPFNRVADLLIGKPPWRSRMIAEITANGDCA